MKNRQALHETFFQTCISHHGCEKSQIYGKLQFLEDLLASQNIDSSYFYSYVTPPPTPTPPYRHCQLSYRFYHHLSGNHDFEY